tara:strand:- start:2224 stop:2646 length:423 start_codon:yes stop_codon:yes gene_type:complete
MRLFSIIFITLVFNFFSIGQDSLDHTGSNANCDSIVKYPDEEAGIANYSSKLQLVRELLLPIFEKHISESSFISKYYFICTIDRAGHLIDVEIKKGIKLSPELKKELELTLIQHTKWTPGSFDQKPCCSQVLFLVNVDLL